MTLLPFRELQQDSTSAVRLDYDGTGNVSYIGLAAPGSATSEPHWAIKKMTYNGSDIVSVTWANGSLGFNNIWDDRAGLSYS